MYSIPRSTVVLTLLAILCVETTIAAPTKGIATRNWSGGSGGPKKVRRTDKPLKAPDLKKESKTYRKTAAESNPAGSYVQSPGGTSVQWDPNAKGDAEHIVEPGAHASGPLNEAGLSKDHPFTKAVKGTLNSGPNLSALDSKTNIGKANLAARPDSDPKHAGPAKDYLQQPSVVDKARTTVAQLHKDGATHGQEEAAGAIVANVVKNIPSADKPPSPKTRRELIEAWLEARALDELLDELD